MVDVAAPKLNPLFKATVTFVPKSIEAPREGVMVLSPFEIEKTEPDEPVIEAIPEGRLILPPVPVKESV